MIIIIDIDLILCIQKENVSTDIMFLGTLYIMFCYYVCLCIGIADSARVQSIGRTARFDHSISMHCAIMDIYVTWLP